MMQIIRRLQILYVVKRGVRIRVRVLQCNVGMCTMGVQSVADYMASSVLWCPLSSTNCLLLLPCCLLTECVFHGQDTPSVQE